MPSALVALPGLALLTDWLLGDPPGWRWHPARIAGNLCSSIEPFFRAKIPSPLTAGILCALCVLLICAGGSLLLTLLAQMLHPLAGFIAGLYFAYSAIALRDLYRHSARVLSALEAADLPLARQRVAMIVGRDTQNLPEAEIARATVETVAENTIDGVTAPLFYIFAGLLLAGAPGAAAGAILYRTANTLDSMIGHMDKRYILFGRFAARLDDVLNFLPARLSIAAITAGAFCCGEDWRGAWKIARRDGRRHRSPNSGLSEAAFAGALGVRLGGNNYYAGEPSAAPVLCDEGIPPERAHIRRANVLLVAASLCFGGLLYLPLCGLHILR